MPVYEYLCQDCGERFDLMRSMKDSDTAAICKHCKSHNTKRALSVFFASSGGRTVSGTSSGGGCAGCGGGSCGSCGHSH